MATALRFSQPNAQQAIRVAALISSPMDHVEPEVISAHLSDVNGHDLTTLAGSPLARDSLNRFLRDKLNLHEAMDGHLPLTALEYDDQTAHAFDLALGQLSRVRALQPHLLAAICQKEIMGALLKTDREALAALLGPDAFAFAAREAAMFYPGLARLAPEAGTVLRQADGTPFETHPAKTFANKVILAYLAAQSELPARIYSLRTIGEDHARHLPFTLDKTQQEEFRRLASRENLS